jgi:hypothetical protein
MFQIALIISHLSSLQNDADFQLCLQPYLTMEDTNFQNSRTKFDHVLNSGTILKNVSKPVRWTLKKIGNRFVMFKYTNVVQIVQYTYILDSLLSFLIREERA